MFLKTNFKKKFSRFLPSSQSLCTDDKNQLKDYVYVVFSRSLYTYSLGYGNNKKQHKHFFFF